MFHNIVYMYNTRTDSKSIFIITNFLKKSAFYVRKPNIRLYTVAFAIEL